MSVSSSTGGPPGIADPGNDQSWSLRLRPADPPATTSGWWELSDALVDLIVDKAGERTCRGSDLAVFVAVLRPDGLSDEPPSVRATRPTAQPTGCTGDARDRA
jgi:hypothetical protein